MVTIRFVAVVVDNYTDKLMRKHKVRQVNYLFTYKGETSITHTHTLTHSCHFLVAEFEETFE